MKFIDYRKLTILLSDEVLLKIQERHSEISIDDINATLQKPFEVRRSRHKQRSELYYSIATKRNRFICVVVKLDTLDGNNYVQTAYTSSKIKVGEILFKESL